MYLLKEIKSIYKFKSYLLPKVLYIPVNVNLSSQYCKSMSIACCTYRPSLTVLTYIAINKYSSQILVFLFILFKFPTKAQFLMFLAFYIKFICFHFYFIVNTRIHCPRPLIHLGRFNHHQYVPKNPIEKHESLYVQPIVNYPIHHPRSLIRLSKLNHHLGGSGTP